MRRLRSSPRCSSRRMPGSSARSVMAARTLSTISAMQGSLGRAVVCGWFRRMAVGSLLQGVLVGGAGGLCRGCFGIRNVGNGVEGVRHRGAGHWETGGGRHQVQIARGGDWQRFWLGRGLRLELLCLVLVEPVYTVCRAFSRLRDGVF